MSKKVRVTKVEIEIGDSKQLLTLDQAKELRDVLNDAFPEDRPITYPTVIHEWPRPYHYWTPTYTSPTYSHRCGRLTGGMTGVTTTSNVLSITDNMTFANETAA